MAQSPDQTDQQIAEPVLWKYRPDYVTQAYQWTGGVAEDLPNWAARCHITTDVLHVPERHGSASARIGDWVVQKPDGALQVIDNAEFHATMVPDGDLPDADDPNYKAIMPPRAPMTILDPRTGMSVDRQFVSFDRKESEQIAESRRAAMASRAEAMGAQADSGGTGQQDQRSRPAQTQRT